MSEVIVYTTTYCGYCYRAKHLLQQLGIAFREVDVTRDRDGRRALAQASGRWTVPQIFIGGEPIGGYQELAQRARDGTLQRLLRMEPDEA
jgi:glutaredoxin 3